MTINYKITESLNNVYTGVLNKGLYVIATKIAVLFLMFNRLKAESCKMV